MNDFVFKGKAISSPADVRQLSINELSDFCSEVRNYVAGIPTDKKAHIESSLGVTELTVALHYLLNTPEDRLIWDVGHQTAVHKVLTGRGGAMYDAHRRMGGISGFPSPAESPYDLFYTGHSSTSISMALGLWLADKGPKTVAVIGDGALTGGQAFEALNIAGEWQADILIILNDNGRSIDPNVGALNTYKRYESFFSSLNIKYLGQVNGNNIELLMAALSQALQGKGPRILHVQTEISNLSQVVANQTLSQPIRAVVSRVIDQCMVDNPDIYVLSPAMLAGAGLKDVRKKWPDRVLDTGITEQACVSIAAGLARGGKLPIVHIYSTFLQRAVDQLIHDIALQSLPVLFIIDRAGLVGEDGPTHHGVFDYQVVASIPGMKVYFPDSAVSFLNTFKIWAKNPHLSAIRIPRDSAVLDYNMSIPPQIYKGAEQTLIAVGAISHQAYKAYNKLISEGIDLNYLTVTSSAFLEDQSSIASLAAQKALFVAEENYMPGSFTGTLISALAQQAKGKKLPKIEPIMLVHEFITHGTPEELLHLTGLSEDGIYQFIIQKLKKSE